MAKVFTVSSKQELVLHFVKKSQPVEQMGIVERFNEKFGYSTKNSARVAIGSMLKKLEANGYVKKKVVKNESRGSIPKNVWELA